MPVESETSVSGSTTTVAVRKEPGPGDLPKVDVTILIDPGKVKHVSQSPAVTTSSSAYATADAANLCYHWKNQQVKDSGDIQFEAVVKRIVDADGNEIPGPVDVTTIVSSGDQLIVSRASLMGGYFVLKLADEGLLPKLAIPWDRIKSLYPKKKKD